MERFGILLKSYGPDLPFAERFLASFQRFSQEPIPLVVVVPDEDRKNFSEQVGRLGTVLPESLWREHLVNFRIHGNSPGYINQEIIKLAFYEIDYFQNYLCADSDAVFIRNFSTEDFMANVETPYTFVTEDSELRVDPVYERTYGKARQDHLEKLRQFLDLPLSRTQTCHNMATFSSLVCRDLSAHLEEASLSWADALEISPYEFSWYNFWLERSGVIPRIEREPIFKMIHMEHQHLALALRGVHKSDLARGYVGLVVNSGFSRAHGVVDLDEPLGHTLGRYVSQRDLAHGLVERVLRRLPRVRRIMHL